MNRMHSKPGRRGPGVALGILLALTLAALTPAAALADPPEITHEPEISGTAQVGETLTADATWKNKGPSTSPAWRWIRCTELDEPDCDYIAGATSSSYTVQPVDEGVFLVVELTVTNNDGSDQASSEPTSAVVAAPTPTPEPSPSPDPSPSPEPTATATTTTTTASTPTAVSAPSPTAIEVRDEQAQGPRMMNPAPVVRIRGRLTASGARITLLTVRAPRGARITVRCLGRRCPARRWAGTASLTRIARFQRAMPAGVRIVITVTKPRRVGKHTLITIRRGAAPTRRDRCLMPGSRTPVRCPAA